MLWAVLDTTTIISGFGWGGPPGAVLQEAVEGRFIVVTSPVLLDELARVMAYEKFVGLFEGGEQLLLFQEMAVLVEPTEELHVLPDEADNRLLEAAATADADHIVTGDRRVLALGRHGRTEIVTAGEFPRCSSKRADRPTG